MVSSYLTACLMLACCSTAQGAFVREAVVNAEGTISVEHHAAKGSLVREAVVAAGGTIDVESEASDLARPGRARPLVRARERANPQPAKRPGRASNRTKRASKRAARRAARASNRTKRASKRAARRAERASNRTKRASKRASKRAARRAKGADKTVATSATCTKTNKRQDTKCSKDARIFKKKDKTLCECKAKCAETPGCLYYSWGGPTSDGENECFGCSSLVMDTDVGFEMYDIESPAPQMCGALVNRRENSKCASLPEDLLFRTEDRTLCDCKAQCAATAGCLHYSWGGPTSEYPGICVGCSDLSEEERTGYELYDLLAHAPPKPPLSTGNCAEPHDFVIGLDASNSIGYQDWPAEVDFANSVIRELLAMNAGHRVATYYFAGVATPVSDFSSDVDALQRSMSALQYADVKFGATNHPDGFFHAKKLLKGSALPDSQKVHLLITDGKPWKSCKHLGQADIDALPCPAACHDKDGTCNYFTKKGRPSGDYCKCAVHEAQVFNGAYTTYTVGILGKNGRIGDEQLMGMASSPKYYMPASFEDLPAKIAEVTAGVCQTTQTTSTTTPFTCRAAGPDEHLHFDVAVVTENNLGGQGPSAGDPQRIRYKNVATQSGTAIDLLVSVAHGGYVPFEDQTIRNGKTGALGLVGLEAASGGNSVDLLFTFVSSGTEQEIVMDGFDLSIFDLDRGMTGARESVTVGGFVSYYLTKDTKIEVTADGERLVFSATQAGNRMDNPADPLDLAEATANKAVNLAFAGVSSLSVTLSVSSTPWPYGRDFLFSGKSAVKDCGVEFPFKLE